MAPLIVIHRASDYAKTPWKNGLGWTEQIAIHPPSADLKRADFLWRISTARVAQSAPFSIFAEHDRLLVILEGEGVRLSHTFEEGEESEKVELPRLEPYEFPGDVLTRCDLLDGPVQDLSVFFRKGEVMADAQIVNLDDGEPEFVWEPAGKTNFAFAVSGSVDLGGEQQLAARDCVRIDFQGGDTASPIRFFKLEATTLVLIQLNYS